MDDETLSAWRALLNAHARVTARVESALAEAGLPPLSWYDVLWPLHRAPGRRLRVGALAEQVTLSRTGLTRLLDRVERDGLIGRRPAPEDRPKRVIRAPDLVPGRAAREAAQAPVAQRVASDRVALRRQPLYQFRMLACFSS